MRFVKVLASLEFFLSALHCSFATVNGNAVNGAHRRILTNIACSNDDPPCSEIGQFCVEGGFCEPCEDWYIEHPGACSAYGNYYDWSESSITDCALRCEPKQCSATDLCDEGIYFCNFANGESGTCEYCNNIDFYKRDQECARLGLSDLGNEDCNLSCGTIYGANTTTKRLLLVWLPRVMAILSFAGSSYIIVDVIISREKRKKTINQLVVGVSIFDLMGSAAYALTTLPIPVNNLYNVYGAMGNEKTCTAQGFFIQIGSISAFINVSLSVYLFMVIKLGWREQQIKKIKVWLFICPILVGLVVAYWQIDNYYSIELWCSNFHLLYLIPVAIGIFVATVMMVFVCYHVRKTERPSRQNNNDTRMSMSMLVFWQSFWYLMAFYATWIPYLAFISMWYTSIDTSRVWYKLILILATAVPTQGMWNFIVYVMRNRKNRRSLSPLPKFVSGILRSTMRARRFTTAPSSQAVSTTNPTTDVLTSMTPPPAMPTLDENDNNDSDL